MDDDAIAEKDYLKNAWSFHLSNPTIHGFGGRIIARYIPSKPKWMSHYVSALVGNFDYAPSVIYFKRNKYPLESNMAVTKQAFDEIDGFNVALPGVKGTLKDRGRGKRSLFQIKRKRSQGFLCSRYGCTSCGRS